MPAPAPRPHPLSAQTRLVRRILLVAALVMILAAAACVAFLYYAVQRPASELAWLLEAASVLTVGFAVLVACPILFGEARLRAAESKSRFWRLLEWMRSTFAGEHPSYTSPGRS